MTKNDKIDKFHEIVNSVANLYAKKNDNYGDSFGKLYEELGPISGLVPLHNKIDRITNMIKGNTNDFESVEDTCRDLIAYTTMFLIEYEAHPIKKESEEK